MEGRDRNILVLMKQAQERRSTGEASQLTSARRPAHHWGQMARAEHMEGLARAERSVAIQ